MRKTEIYAYLSKLSKPRAGFTLTEVLAAVVILGVMLTIVTAPVINDVKNMDVKTQWKKNYSDILQISYTIINNHKGSFKGACADSNHNCLKDEFTKYLFTSKTCNAGSAMGVCWHDTTAAGMAVKKMDGSLLDRYINDYAAVILKNGASLMFYMEKSQCDDTTYSTVPECGLVVIDTNGFGSPNQIGKDIFYMKMTENGIVPFGYNDGYEDDCTIKPPTGYGFGCAAQYISE